MACIVTRIEVGDWRHLEPVFDQDQPGARTAVKGHRILRSVERPNGFYIVIGYAPTEGAEAAREKLLAEGVLDRLADKDLPKALAEAEAVIN